MPRTMYDAVDAQDVPTRGFDLLAGYINGNYQSYGPLKVRFPHATVVSIDVLNHPGAGQVLDIEQGDALPNEAPSWFDRSLVAGIVRPTLYYSSSDHSLIKGYMSNRKYDAWVASYGVPHCPVSSDSQVTVVAWQKIDHGPNGENIDISDVFDPYWPLEGGPFMALTDAEQTELRDEIRAMKKQLDQMSATMSHLYNFVNSFPSQKPFPAFQAELDAIKKKTDQLS